MAPLHWCFASISSELTKQSTTHKAVPGERYGLCLKATTGISKNSRGTFALNVQKHSTEETECEERAMVIVVW